MQTQDTIEAAAAGAAASGPSRVTRGAPATAVGGWFLSNELAVLAGLVIGLVGLGVQWYYRHKEYKLREREHHARMSEFERE